MTPGDPWAAGVSSTQESGLTPAPVSQTSPDARHRIPCGDADEVEVEVAPAPALQKQPSFSHSINCTFSTLLVSFFGLALFSHGRRRRGQLGLSFLFPLLARGVLIKSDWACLPSRLLQSFHSCPLTQSAPLNTFLLHNF